MSKELLKTIEAQGKRLTELRAENEQLKWQIGSELVDLRDEIAQIRMKLDELSKLSM